MASRFATRFLSLLTVLVFAAMAWFATHTEFGGVGSNRSSSGGAWPVGAVAPGTPYQTAYAAPPVQLEGFTVTPQAQFQITARVLKKKRYRFDTQADLMPWDFAMGWGPMSDSRIIDQLDISQSGRWYYWSYPQLPPIDPALITQSSANMHLIPLDESVREVLDDADEGDVVTLTGDLVNVAGKGWTINSSLTREDSGGGACEVILVRTASIQQPPQV